MEKTITEKELTIDTEGRIIQDIIHKAVKGGFNFKDFSPSIKSADPFFCMIFSHEFAKAFWGEEVEDVRCSYCIEVDYPSCSVCKDEVEVELAEWQYHLQKMVLCEEPLDYLKKFL